MRNIDDYAEKYTREPFENVMVKIRKRMIISQCTKYDCHSMLEVGCGLSPLFMDMDHYSEMTIVEPSRHFAENAQMLAETTKCNRAISVYNDFVENVSDALRSEKRFDIIVVSSLLHEVEYPQKLLKSIRDLCDDTTVVHFNVPNAYSLHRLIALEMGIISDVHDRSAQQVQMQRHSTYDMKSFEDEICDGGFEVVEKGSYFVKPFTHAQMKKCMDDGIMERRILDGLYRLVEYMPELGSEIFIDFRWKS